MPKTAVRPTERVSKNGVRHNVKGHRREIPGAKKAPTRSFGFQPITPTRATCGALVGSAAYWTFAASMSVVAALMFSIATACAALMGEHAVRGAYRKRKAKRGGRKSVARLRAEVKFGRAKERFSRWNEKRVHRRSRWKSTVQKMPLKRRLNPSYRMRRYWNFRVNDYKQVFKKTGRSLLNKVKGKLGPRVMERFSTRKGRR